MQEPWIDELREDLRKKKGELERRLGRINLNLRQTLESDSKERAMQLENQEVVDALGNEARLEIAQIASALTRIDEGVFGLCTDCGDKIARNRLLAYPQAEKCIDCASLDDDRRRVAG